MVKMPATEFKAKCLDLMDQVAERRLTYVITKHGKPVARLVPMEERAADSLFGWMRGRGRIKGDVVAPAVTPEAWGVLGEHDDLARRDVSRRRAAPSARRRRRS